MQARCDLDSFFLFFMFNSEEDVSIYLGYISGSIIVLIYRVTIDYDGKLRLG